MTIEELKEIVKDATQQAFDGERISPDEKGAIWPIIAGERLWFRTMLDSVDTEPTTHGRWICNDKVYPAGNLYRYYDCDQCGESVPHKTNYCPNCGARMDEVENGR